MRADWLRAQDRKRKLLAWGLAGLAYLLVGGVFVLRSLFGFETLSSGMGTIQVRLGTPEGEDEFSRIIPALSSGSGADTDAVAAAVPPAGELPPPPSEVPLEKAPADAAAQEAPPKPAASPAAPKAPAKPAAQAATPTTSQAAPQGGSPGPAIAGIAPSATGIPSGSPSGSGSVSLKGSEAGNSFETNFDTGSGKIGRSLYVPIYLYMPLPRFLDKDLYDRVPPHKFGLESAELRKAHLRDLYDLRGTLLTLKGEVPLAERPSIWVMLEDAGYPVGNADYKKERSLKPIVIEFSVGPPAADYASSGAPLKSSVIVSSSGYPEIDEAVLYAFRMAGFSNNTETTVKGRFTYNFSR